MEYLLFIIYLFLLTWLVTRIPFFKKTGLTKPQLILLLLLKIITGIAYGCIGLYYDSYYGGHYAGMAGTGDTWTYHYSGILEYQLLGSHPYEYFTNLFNNPYPHGLLNFFGSSDSYWNDLKTNVFIKLLSVFDIFSFGHYYVNVIFYSFLALFGELALYRVMKDVLGKPKIALVMGLFLIPSFLYWSSGIHREGFIFLGIVLMVYPVHFGNAQGRMNFKRWLSLAIGLFLLLVLRNFLVVLVVPAVLAWLLANRWPRHGLAVFLSVYALFCLLFFTLRYVDPALDFPQAVVNKQQSFIGIVGNTSIPIDRLRPTVGSFVRNTPQAISLSVLRPYPSDIHNLLTLAVALEAAATLVLLALFLFVRRKGEINSPHTLYFLLFFSISLLLAIGFSVNNLGAIVRYRSIVLPLLVTPMLALIDWKRLFNLFSAGRRTG